MCMYALTPFVFIRGVIAPKWFARAIFCPISLSQAIAPIQVGRSAQDRRGHLKAQKFDQGCSQVSELCGSFSLLSFCRHRDYRGLYFAAWIDLFFDENSIVFTAADYCSYFIFCLLNKERMSLLSNVYFKKSSKEGVIKWEFWNCNNILQSFIAQLMIFFSNFCDHNWTFYRQNRLQSGQKSHLVFIFCNFLNRVHVQLPNLQQLYHVTNTLRKFQRNCTIRLFVVWVRVNRDQIYNNSLQPTAASNLLLFIER